MLKKDIIKKFLPYIAAAIAFLLISCIYLSPILEGKVLSQHDTTSWICMSHEVLDYKEKTGHDAYWTNSMFSGMPTYQIAAETTSGKVLRPLEKIFWLGLPETLAFFWCYLIGFFILMRAFNINPWLSIVGSIAITFSSYFFIIIGAGHNTKALTIGAMAAVIGGFTLLMKRKYCWGMILTMFFIGFSALRHPQMTYYAYMLIGVLAIAELFIALKNKTLKSYGIGLGLFCLATVIGLGTNYTFYKLNQDYVQETMRGGHSELTKKNTTEIAQKQEKGLDLEYATNWSYGIDETMTLLIPNFKGGSSNYDVGENSEIYNTLIKHGVPRKNASEFCKNVPTYWGTQPFTSGPVYIGAIIFFLFVLGLIIVKGPYKWALLFATLMSILLALGKNFMPLTELFFNYFPMYNKFRAVTSILIVAEIAMPLLGFLAIKTIMDKKIDKLTLRKSIYISGGITAGICLIFALFGSSFYNFTASTDESTFAQLPEWLTPAIISERASMLKADAFRSFIFVIIGLLIIYLFTIENIKKGYIIALLGIFILGDMWIVNKRFLNNDHFVTENKYNKYLKKTEAETIILQDKDPHFRVFNLATNTFNDARTSYYLKSIGGYHAAKLRRYQDIIDEHLSKMNMNVINMLNAKYVIINDQQTGREIPQLNREAFGNVWFVDSLYFVNTPDEECEALNHIHPLKTAVADISFKNILNQNITTHDTLSSIRLTSCTPDVITYESNTSKNELAVFSEIYYPKDWKAYIDDKPVEIGRVDYILRALYIPGGKHQIRFEFKPSSIAHNEIIAFISLFLMFGISIGLIIHEILLNKKKKQMVHE